eukprot:757477-Rhodomonas_salina.3
MFDTDIGSADPRCRACQRTPWRRRLCLPQVRAAICLRNCYAMPGTDMAYGAICPRACYAMSGTDTAYGGRPQRGPALRGLADAALGGSIPRMRCAILTYASVRCPVLKQVQYTLPELFVEPPTLSVVGTTVAIPLSADARAMRRAVLTRRRVTLCDAEC